MKFAKTRIAPTPSGFLHLGNAYSFLLTKVLAEKHGAKILLRIDDLDRERYRQEYVQDILDTLDFLEIQIHQGPGSVAEFESQWTQQERMPLYYKALEQLQLSKLLFSCTCTRNQILQIDPRGIYLGQCMDRRMPLEKNDAAWRINTLDADFLEYISYPASPKSALIPEEASCYVVRKKDKNPAYQLCSLIDDIHFEVDLIVRGQDLFPSTLAQLDLARILGKEGFAKTTFFHHPLVKGPTEKKLSKSAGAYSIRQLRQDGKSLREVFQMLGKSLGFQEEIHTFQEFYNKVIQ